MSPRRPRGAGIRRLRVRLRGRGGGGFGEGGGDVGGEFAGHDGVVGLGHGEDGGGAVAVGGTFAGFGEGLGEGDLPHGDAFAAGGAADLGIHAFELRVGQASGGGGAFLGGVGAGEGGLEGRGGGDGFREGDGGVGRRAEVDLGVPGEGGEEQGDEKECGAHVHGVTCGVGLFRRKDLKANLSGGAGGVWVGT